MRRLPVLVVASIVLAGSLTAAPITLARFTRAPASTGSFGTGSILPPTGLSASVSGTVVTLTWTPTTSTVVTGYAVRRSTTSGSGYTTIATVTPRSATTTTDSPGTGTFYYVLRSQFQNWDSVASNEATAVVGSVATGTRTAPRTRLDTGGDNDGYQTNPGNACALDNTRARDINSGTTNSLGVHRPRPGSPPVLGLRVRVAGQHQRGERHPGPADRQGQQQRRQQPDLRAAVVGRRCELDGDEGRSTSPTAWSRTRSGLRPTPGATRGRSRSSIRPTSACASSTSSSMSGKDFDLDAIRVQVNYTP